MRMINYLQFVHKLLDQEKIFFSMSTASPKFQAKEFMFMVKLFEKKVDNKRNNKSQH